MDEILALSQSHGSAGLRTGVRLSDIAQPSRLLPNTHLIPNLHTSLAKDCAARPNSIPFANPRFPCWLIPLLSQETLYSKDECSQHSESRPDSCKKSFLRYWLTTFKISWNDIFLHTCVCICVRVCVIVCTCVYICIYVCVLGVCGGWQVSWHTYGHQKTTRGSQFSPPLCGPLGLNLGCQSW